MPIVQSSNLSEVDWIIGFGEEAPGVLLVTFKNGLKYKYKQVPAGIYEKMLASPSIGSFFDLYIKKAGYQYEKVVTSVQEAYQAYPPEKLKKKVAELESYLRGDGYNESNIALQTCLEIKALLVELDSMLSKM